MRPPRPSAPVSAPPSRTARSSSRRSDSASRTGRASASSCGCRRICSAPGARRARGPRGSRWRLPVGMALGALAGGDAVDRFLGGNHPRLIVLCLVLAAGATLGLVAAPPDARSLVLLFAAGFLVFGPFPSFTVLGAELLGPRTVGAGVGFMNARRVRDGGARRRRHGRGDRRHGPDECRLRGRGGGVRPRGGRDRARRHGGPAADLTRAAAVLRYAPVVVRDRHETVTPIRDSLTRSAT